ncbi:hypothetical protein NAP1_11493 [Erythrobacter sp. NAP1]|nr:hypothetical protein NAP1_11493 [Erythrobacter sp. NAP1]
MAADRLAFLRCNINLYLALQMLC